MKAISIKQPWAYLICAGVKPIENRTWKCPQKYIGERVFIHASGKPDKEPSILFSNDQIIDIDRSDIDIFSAYNELGAIIGSVQIVDCVINHSSIWAEESQYVSKVFYNIHVHGSKDWIRDCNKNLVHEQDAIYNWVLDNPILFYKPIYNVKGKLSFWDYPNIHSEPDDCGNMICCCNLPSIKEVDQVSNFIDHFRCRYCGGIWYK